MTDLVVHKRNASERNGVRLHRFSRREFHRLIESGAIPRGDPVELVDGLLAIKRNTLPPFGVPNGIPPEVLWGDDRLPDHRPLRRMTVREFDRLVDFDVIEDDVRFELAEGWVVDKMSRNPRHDSTLQILLEAIHNTLPGEWKVRSQMGVTLDESKYEPDIAIVPGPVTRYRDRHPVASEVLLIAEISGATLRFDRGIKLRSYARNMIKEYWIVNIVKCYVEVYSAPSGPTDQPQYEICERYLPGQRIVVRRGARKIFDVAVSEFLNA